jgi:hypothetical protein
MNYNVTYDLASWAKTRVALWDKPRREAIRKEFDRLDREEHLERIKERERRNGWRSPEVPMVDPEFDERF